MGLGKPLQRGPGRRRSLEWFSGRVEGDRSEVGNREANRGHEADRGGQAAAASLSDHIFEFLGQAATGE